MATLSTVLYLLFNARTPEPVYQGKPLSYWLSDFWPGRNPTPEKLEQDRVAVRHIGTNAIPVLLEWIAAKEGPFKRNLVRWIARHPWVPFRVESSVDKNMLAGSGFWILGKAQARSAVPALVEIIRKGGSEKTSGDNTVTFALLALAELDPEAAAKAGAPFGTNGIPAGATPAPATMNQ